MASAGERSSYPLQEPRARQPPGPPTTGSSVVIVPFFSDFFWLSSKVHNQVVLVLGYSKEVSKQTSPSFRLQHGAGGRCPPPDEWSTTSILYTWDLVRWIWGEQTLKILRSATVLYAV